MLDFQRYQTAFTAHIRDPKANPKPEGVNTKRMAVYKHGVFNNIFESVSICFPVCQNVLGKRKWLQLCKLFFAQHASHTPLFREIPEAFLDFINAQDLTQLKLPAFIPQLAHYEWAELGISHMPAANQALSNTTDLLNERPVLTGAHLLLAYDYPVQMISKKIQLTEQTKTYILMFRNSAFKIKFVELNVVTFELLKLIKNNAVSGYQALMQKTPNHIMCRLGLEMY